ncbi:MAG TPA: hypothetical protein P5531_04955 [Bacteroidales bacterium]|nr:hypothetical protein [Bacteroidales bacterium]HSA42647.1 hypothetical protein [Bacteroidales bacterium]
MTEDYSADFSLDLYQFSEQAWTESDAPRPENRSLAFLFAYGAALFVCRLENGMTIHQMMN